MNMTPGSVPPPPPEPGASGTQIAGQQTAPSSTVPAGPPGAMATSASTQTNTLAIVSLVAALGSFVAHVIPGVGGFVVALVAVITGFMARSQIRRTGEQGMGLATAGIIIGLVHLGFIVVAVLVVLFLIFIVGIAFFGVSAHH